MSLLFTACGCYSPVVAAVPPRPRCAVRIAILASAGCAALALAGCANGLEGVYSTDFWVEPGKYDFLKCPDLAKQSAAASAHEKELVGLMERANQSTAGPVVNLMVYDADLKQTRSQLALLERTAHQKGCDKEVPQSKANPTVAPAAKSGRPR